MPHAQSSKYVSKDQIEQAKMVDLLTYLRTFEPQELMHLKGDTYCTKTHDSLKISHGKWCWWSKHIGGKTALDYLIKVRGMEFTDAVSLLCGDGSRLMPIISAVKLNMPRRFELPKANHDNKRVIAYLKHRGIDMNIIDYCIETGRIYESRQFSNAVFVGFDAMKTPRYAFMRGTSTHSDFRLDVPGSDKRHCFSIMTERPCDTVYIFESAIDLLSYATLLNVKDRNWKDYNYLALGGVYLSKENISEIVLPLALAQYLMEHPDTRNITLCLDSDDAGRQAAQAITSLLKDAYTVTNSPPQKGKDYNDMLMSYQMFQKSKDAFER
jgi:hypothetical protein